MNYLLSVAALLAFGTLSAQSGFYGRKTVVDVSANGRLPLFNNFNAINKTALSPGVSFAFARAVTAQVSVGAEFCMQFNAFDSQKYMDTYQSDSIRITYTDVIRYRSAAVLFKVEFHQQNMAPYGFSHVVAAGPTFNRCIDRDYSALKYQDYDYQYYGVYNAVNGHADFHTKATGLTLMYAFNVRHAITESLWLNYGIRTTLNIPVASRGAIDLLTGDANYRNVRSAIDAAQIRNIFSARIGLSYAF